MLDDYTDASAPAAPGASKTRLYSVSGKPHYRAGAAGADAEIVSPLSAAQGDIIYFDGTNWVRLAASTSGYLLKTQGAGANPIWAVAGPDWDYQSVVTAAATQRLAYWLSDDLQQTCYLLGGNVAVTRQGQDATTGRDFFRTGSTTTAGQTSYIELGQDTNGFQFRTMRAAENIHFKALVRQQTAPVGGTVDYYAGFRLDAVSGQSDGIYLRSTNAGNWTLVCRNIGVETTSSLGTAPSGTLLLLEIQVSADGTSVRGYLNGTAQGSAITTNIPTGLLKPMIMMDNRAGVVTTSGVIDCYGFGWIADAVA